MLSIESAQSGYGASQVLFGVDLQIGAGQVVTLLGRNGMGKTTLLRTLFGQLPLRGGKIRFADQDISGWSPDRIARNMGNQLSGGEQQMLAIGRALVTNPRLLILDEATEGLAPKIREEIWNCLARLRQAGQTILVIDKYVERLLSLADRHVILERGKVVWTGDSAALDADRGLWERYLGV